MAAVRPLSGRGESIPATFGRCLGDVLQASITINLFPGDYTASSRLIPSRVTQSQAGID